MRALFSSSTDRLTCQSASEGDVEVDPEVRIVLRQLVRDIVLLERGTLPRSHQQHHYHSHQHKRHHHHKNK